MPTQNVAVMLPKSMKFASGGSVAFQPINDDVERADLPGAKCLAFAGDGVHRLRHGLDAARVAGTGASDAAGARWPDLKPVQTSAANDTRPGGGLGNPIDTPDPLNKYKWWILSGLALVLAVAAAFLLRAKPEAAVSASLL